MFANSGGMRRDLILPAVLLAALLVMAVYATTGAREPDESGLATAPAACSQERLIGKLPELPEASGLAASRAHRGVLWTHNDSADPVLVAVRTDGSVAGRTRLNGARVVDWEAVTVAPCAAGTCVYVGDIGDNDRNRRSVTVYRVPEPSLSDGEAEVEAFEATYPEGPQDAEALFVLRGTLYVATKGEGAPVRVYRFPRLESGPRLTLELVTTLTVDQPKKRFRVTDAAVSPDGRSVALRSNDLILFYEAAGLLAGKPATPQSYDLSGIGEPQGEGITWTDGRTLFLAGEAEGGGTLARVTCSAARHE
jgi:hypothetical protein